jgi:hypothetical protein
MSGGVFVPRSYLEIQKAMRRMGLLTFISWADLSDTEMSIERLVGIVQQLPTELMLKAVAGYALLLGNRPSDLNERRLQQAVWAAEMAPSGLESRARELIVGERRSLFIHEEQLLVMVRLAVLYGRDGPPTMGEAERNSLGEVLFGINSLLRFGDQKKAEDLAVMLALRSQALAGNEQLRYQLSRYFDLLVTRSRAYSGDPPALDLDHAFRAATGLSVEEYIGFGLMYVGHLVGKGTMPEIAGMPIEGLLSSVERQIKDPAKLDICRRLFTRTIPEFRAVLATEGLDLPVLKTMPFRETPFVRLQSGGIYPISLHLAMEKIATGVYWILHGHFATIDPVGGVEKLTKYIGSLHQDYLTELLARTYPSTSSGILFLTEAAVIAASPRPPKGRPSRPPFDAAIVEGDTLVLIEMGTPMIANAAAENADVRGYRDQVKKFVAKVDQLKRAIDEIESARWVLPGLDLSSIRHIFPVVGLLHSFPCLPTTLEPLQSAMEAGVRPFATTVAATRVYPVQIITDEEFEMLEPQLKANTYSLPGLLKQKVSADDSGSVSMKNFLINYLGWVEVLNDAMSPLYQAATQAAAATLAINLDEFVTQSVSVVPKAG